MRVTANVFSHLRLRHCEPGGDGWTGFENSGRIYVLPALSIIAHFYDWRDEEWPSLNPRRQGGYLGLSVSWLAWGAAIRIEAKAKP